MNPATGSALLWPAQRLLNAVLAADSHARRQLAPLEGRSLAIAVTHPPLRLGLTLKENRLELCVMDPTRQPPAADATVSGSAGTLARLLLADQDQQALVNPGLSIEGDVQLVQDLFVQVRRLDIQWQDLLTPWLGELATEQFSRLLGSSWAWARDSHGRMCHSLEAYLQDELKLVPHGGQLRHYYTALDEFRLRLDRLEARTARLASALAAQQAGSR